MSKIIITFVKHPLECDIIFNHILIQKYEGVKSVDVTKVHVIIMLIRPVHQQLILLLKSHTFTDLT